MIHRTKKIISYVVSVVVIAAAAVWIGSKFYHSGNVEFTDNALVCRQIIPVNSRVQGYIKEIRFEEFGEVHKGDTLVIIDDADMRLNMVSCFPTRPWAIFPKWRTIRRILRREGRAARKAALR